MDSRKRNIIIASSVIGLVAAFLIFRKIRAKNVYTDLMKIVQGGQGESGTISDAKDIDPQWNANYWATLVQKNTMKSTDFNLKNAQSIAAIIYTGSPEDIVSKLMSVPTKAQMSYIAYWYLQKSGKKQTILAKIKDDLSKNDATKVMNYSNTLPAY